MKRCVVTLLSLGLVGLALAQAPFTIVRPADGSKVREKVHFTIPLNSVPPGGYIGVFTTTTDAAGNQKRRFIEAVVPRPPSKNPDYDEYAADTKSKFLEYVMDTKAMGVPDGKLNVELVLYVEYSAAPKIVDRSSVDLTVANSASIKVPEEGFKLRYKFHPGVEYVYDLEARVAIATLTEAQNNMGARPGDLPLEAERVRLLYAIDNVYPNGDALIRTQALPTKGLDFAYLTAEGDTAPRKYMDYEMASIYRRISGTGMELFGAVPAYWPLEGTSGEGSNLDLFANFPWPTLPDKPRKPNDSWQSRFQGDAIDLTKIHEQNKLVTSDIARGEFLRVEWESGFPCAVLRNTFEEANPDKEAARLAARGSSFTSAKVSEEQTIWFALDRGIVIKVIRNLTIEGKATIGGGTGNRAGPGQGAPGGRMGGGRGGPGASGGPGGGAPPIDLAQKQGPGGPGMSSQAMGGPGAAGRPGAPGGGRNSGSGSGGQTRFLRIILQEVFTLEQ